MNTRIMALSIFVVGIAGCTTARRGGDAGEMMEGMLGFNATERQLDEMIAKRPALPSNPAIALAWVDSSPRRDHEDTELRDNVAMRLAGSSVGRVVTIPEVHLAPPGLGREDILLRYRTAAAHFRSDLMVLVAVRTDELSDANFFAVLYPALVTIPFVPAADLEVRTSMDACLIDVRTGTVFGCTSTRGEAHRNFTSLIGQEEMIRDLRRRALADATANLPMALTTEIARAQTDTAVTRGNFRGYYTNTD